MPACPVGPRENTGTGPADRTGMVIFFTCLDLEQKSSFMDGHYLKYLRDELCRFYVTIFRKSITGILNFRANAFESQYRENAPRRRVSLSNRLKLVLKHP